MPTSIPFATAVEIVNTALTEKTKHLHLKTKKIIEEGDLEAALKNIQKKNFTLTSSNHLAAILIKIIEIYVDKCKNKNVITFIKYIKLLQTENLDLLTVRKILKVLNLDKLTELIEKKYDSISDEAKKILKNVTFTGTDIELDTKVMGEFDTTNTQITAATGGLLTSLQSEKLSTVFEQIKNVCKDSFSSKKLLTPKLINCLPIEFRVKPSETKTHALTQVNLNLFNEFAYLYHVIKHDDEGAGELLKKCHKDAVRKLLTAKRRIKDACDAAANAEKEEKTDAENKLVIDKVDEILRIPKLSVDAIKTNLKGLQNNDKIVALKPALEKVNNHLALTDFETHLFLKKDALQDISDEAYNHLKTLFYRARRIRIFNTFNQLLQKKWTNHTDLTGEGTVNTFLNVIQNFFKKWKQNPIHETHTYISDIVISKNWEFIDDTDKHTAVKKEVGLGNFNIINNNLRALRDTNNDPALLNQPGQNETNEDS